MLVIIFHALDPPQNLRKIERLNRDALRFKNLLAITHRIERRRTRTNSANPQISETVYYTADSRKPLQVFGELRRVGALRVQCSDRIRNAILPQVVTSR